MRESQVIVEWQADAKARGLAQGQAERARADLLRVLQLRFPGAVPSDLATRVERLTDLDELARWFDAAVTAPSLDAFRVAVRP
jgi:hypothetical protein